MKLISIVNCVLIYSLFFLVSCAHPINRTVASAPSVNVESNSELSAKIASFQELIEENFVWQTRAIAFFAKIEKQEIYSNKDLVQLHENGTFNYKKLRDAFFLIIDEYKWMVSYQTKINFVTSEKSSAHKSSGYEDALVDGMTLDKNITLKINRDDTVGQDYIKNIKMSLASALTLYDNYLLVIEQYQQIKKMRRLLNIDNQEYPDYLREINDAFNDFDNYERLARAIAFFKEQRDWERDKKISLTQDDQYLNALIERSYFYSKNDNIGYFDLLFSKFKTVGQLIRDRLFKIRDSSMNEGSKIFGNLVGKSQSRSGKLLNMPEAEQADIKSQLKALDVLLEKTPFRLTDKFIPGHWGHVALWIGTEEELRELSVWEELPALYAKAVKLYNYEGPSFQEAIRNGHNIVEALRPGVQINTLKHFLDIDDFAAIRPRELSVEKKREYLINAFKQIGKEYDFNFNVETDKKIVCSELAYVVFYDDLYRWPVEKALGRQTISPDNVAQKAVEGELFYPVLLYHDGKRLSVESKRLEDNFRRLFETKYDQIDWEIDDVVSIENKAPTRAIASENSFIDAHLASDYFVTNTFDKSVNYKIGFNFRTNKDQDYLKQRAQLALRQAFANTLNMLESEDNEEGKTPLFKIFKGELVKELMNNFVKTLAVVKIVNGTFQIDLSLTPEKDSAESLDSELSSNQLIAELDKGKFFERLSKKSQTLIDKVYANIPTDENSEIQYAGGNITIWLNILDGKKFLMPAKMAANGFIRFRRYYKVNKQIFDLKHNSPELALNSSKLVAKNKDGRHYITVDVYNTFDSKNMVPVLDKMEVSFGQLLPNDFISNSLIKNFLTPDLTGIKTSGLVLSGKFKTVTDNSEFKTELSKIVYSFSANAITDMNFITDGFVDFEDTRNSAKELRLKNKLLTSFNKELVDKLFLDKFYTLDK